MTTASAAAKSPAPTGMGTPTRARPRHDRVRDVRDGEQGDRRQEEDGAPGKGIAVRGGGGERDGDGADEQRRHGGPLDPQTPPRRRPRGRGRSAAEGTGPRSAACTRASREESCCKPRAVAAAALAAQATSTGRSGRRAVQPPRRSASHVSPAPRPASVRTAGCENQTAAAPARAAPTQPAREGDPVGEMDGQERERDRHGGVGRVLLDLGAVRDHRRAESKEGGREDGGPARKDAAREQREQPERREAAEQGHEAQGELARTEERDATLDERQESGRGDLVERERLAERGRRAACGSRSPRRRSRRSTGTSARGTATGAERRRRQTSRRDRGPLPAAVARGDVSRPDMNGGSKIRAGMSESGGARSRHGRPAPARRARGRRDRAPLDPAADVQPVPRRARDGVGERRSASATILARARLFPQSVPYVAIVWLARAAGGSSELVLRLPSLVAAGPGRVRALPPGPGALRPRDRPSTRRGSSSRIPAICFAAGDARPYAFGVLATTGRSGCWCAGWSAAGRRMPSPTRCSFRPRFTSSSSSRRCCRSTPGMRSAAGAGAAPLGSRAAGLRGCGVAALTAPACWLAREVGRDRALHAFEAMPGAARARAHAGAHGGRWPRSSRAFSCGGRSRPRAGGAEVTVWTRPPREPDALWLLVLSAGRPRAPSLRSVVGPSGRVRVRPALHAVARSRPRRC